MLPDEPAPRESTSSAEAAASTPSPPAEDDTQPAIEGALAAQAPPNVRFRAIFEVMLCSDYPTQLLIAAGLAQIGIVPLDAEGRLSSRFVYLVSAIDTVALLGLIFFFLRAGGERPRDVFLRRGDPIRELRVGLALVPLVFVVVFMLQVGIYLVVPFLRNVPQNPFQSLLGSPLEIAAFILLVLIAGGVREELQRAFLLHRFDQHLGGARLGVAITSIGFGLGHALQGWDAVVVTGLLGAFWGTIYVWRRNVIPTIVSHALFNAGEVLLAFAALRQSA